MNSSAGKTGYGLIISGVLVNLLMGLIYGWGILLGPLEVMLDAPRSYLSLAPAAGLLCFTIGVFVYEWLARRILPSVLIAGALMAAGLGCGLFYWFPGYTALLVGPGAIFGLFAGICYGAALELAVQGSETRRGWAIGLVVASFAASAMLVSVLSAIYGIPQSTQSIFGIIASLFCGASVVIGIGLRGVRLKARVTPAASNGNVPIFTWAFVRMAVAYFSMCYLGLMMVSHGAAITSWLGFSVAAASLTPFIFNSGYIMGGLCGGIVAERFRTYMTPSIVLGAMSLSIILFGTSIASDGWVIAVLVVGLGFGSTVSMFVTLLSMRYGVDRAGLFFGRINIGYGLAGFIAPALTGRLYDFGDGYTLPLFVACIIGSIGFMAMVGGGQTKPALELR